MKPLYKLALLIVISVAVSSAAFAGKGPGGWGGRGGGNAGLDTVEASHLTFMREEEKLARDVYAELYQYHKDENVELLIFANIANSEQRHMNAMLRLLNRYRLEDPADGALPGEFENEILSELYVDLVSSGAITETDLNEPTNGGKVSPTDAFYVGAWIEERDMLDILLAISNTSRADIVGVYTNLLCGSRSHLRAFVARIGADAYEPQLLSPESSSVPATETLEYWLSDESDEICM